MGFWRKSRGAAKDRPLELVTAGDPILRQAAAPVTDEVLGSAETQALIDRMIATMRAAPGVGLAAPQVGVGLAIAVFEDKLEYMGGLTDKQRAERGRTPLDLLVVVNPHIDDADDGASATFLEGCLSVPGYMGLVDRSRAITLRAQDRSGKSFVLPLTGWPARIAQHEIDHLRGTLYVDRMVTRSFSHNEHVKQRWLHEPVAEMRRLLDA